MIKIVAATDIGLKRKLNEDAFYIDPKRTFVIVADGMGGHASGEIASTAAVTAICTHLEKYQPASNEAVGDILVKAIEFANEIVFDMNGGKAEERSMGTTIVMAYFYEDNGTTKAHIAHVGDSRAYVVSDSGGISQLTSDHNVVNSLMEMGKITEEQAEEHPQRNVLTRAVGTDSIVEVDVAEIEMKRGTYILLCTDGLTNAISDFELEQLIKAGKGPKALCQLANRRSGKDNVTVAIATA